MDRKIRASSDFPDKTLTIGTAMITHKMFRNSLLFSFDSAGLPRHVGIEPGVKLTRTRAEVGRQAGTAQYNRFTDHCTVGRFAPVQERESLLSGGIL